MSGSISQMRAFASMSWRSRDGSPEGQWQKPTERHLRRGIQLLHLRPLLDGGHVSLVGQRDRITWGRYGVLTVEEGRKRAKLALAEVVGRRSRREQEVRPRRHDDPPPTP